MEDLQVVALEALGWLVESGKGWFPGWLVGAGNHAVASAVRQAEAGAAARATESSVSRLHENTRSTVIGLAALSWCLFRMAAKWPVIGMSTLSWIDQALDNLILAQILRSERPGIRTTLYTGNAQLTFGNHTQISSRHSSPEAHARLRLIKKWRKPASRAKLMKLVRTARVEEAERYLEAHERERKLAQILKSRKRERERKLAQILHACHMRRRIHAIGSVEKERESWHKSSKVIALSNVLCKY